jgi:hypothetical protein
MTSNLVSVAADDPMIIAEYSTTYYYECEIQAGQEKPQQHSHQSCE